MAVLPPARTVGAEDWWPTYRRQRRWSNAMAASWRLFLFRYNGAPLGKRYRPSHCASGDTRLKCGIWFDLMGTLSSTSRVNDWYGEPSRVGLPSARGASHLQEQPDGRYFKLGSPEASAGAMVKAPRAIGEAVREIIDNRWDTSWRSSDGLRILPRRMIAGFT
jgi:hypothetical protein